MKQTLFYIPNELFGIPILRWGEWSGVGLLLLVVLVCGGIGLWNKYRREGTEGDFAGSATVLGIICLAILFVLPRIADEQGLPIRGYGAMLLIAVVSGVALGMWRARQVGANPEIILSMMFLIFVGGIVGARGLFVIEYWKQFRPDTRMTVHDEDGEEEAVMLDNNTAISVDGETAGISALREGQRAKLVVRREYDPPWARRVTATTTDAADAGSGVLGESKIDSLSHYSGPAIGKSFGKIVDVTKGGIVIYGALFGAAVPFVWYICRHKLPILPLCDIVVASLLLGQALGRLGCMCNGCCYGSVCEKPNLPQVQFPYQTPPYLHQVEASANPKARHKLYVAGLVLKKADDTDQVEIAAVEEGSEAANRRLRSGMRITDMWLDPVLSEEQLLSSMEKQGRVAETTRRVFDPTVDEAYRLLYESGGKRLALEVRDDEGPHGVAWTLQQPAPRESLPVHPTQLYEAIYAGLMCLFAWLYFPFRRRDGEVFAVMLTMFPFFRFLNEWIRTDEAPDFLWGVTISQMISIGLLLSAIPFWWWVLRKPAGSTLTPTDWAPLNARWAATA